MIKTLKKKFIFAAMTAITALILVLLSIINIAYAWSMSFQTDRLLEILSVPIKGALPPNAPFEPTKDFFVPQITEDTKLSAVYFTVHEDTLLGTSLVDVSHIASVDKEEALSMAEQLKDLPESQGKLGQFKYKTTTSPDGYKKTHVFLNTSFHTSTILRVLVLSLLVGLLCWGLMLLLVILLSKKAIAPIAANIEKQKHFVTDAGHEIKTPLAIILANTEAMELYQGENKWSHNIREQIQRLSGLTQTLLTLAKANEESQSFSAELISVSDLAQKIIQMFSEPASLKKLTIVSSITPSVMFNANKEHIQQLFSLLLDNAVKYTPEVGTIVISVQKEGKKLFLQFKNTCEKFPDCPPEFLFDRFYRADSARTQKSGGYGIGLSAAKAIVELYHGKITAAYEKDHMISFTIKM